MENQKVGTLESDHYSKFHSLAWKYFIISLLSGAASTFFGFTEGFAIIGLPFILGCIIFTALSLTNFILYIIKAKNKQNISIYSIIGIILVVIEILLFILLFGGFN